MVQRELSSQIWIRVRIPWIITPSVNLPYLTRESLSLEVFNQAEITVILGEQSMVSVKLARVENLKALAPVLVREFRNLNLKDKRRRKTKETTMECFQSFTLDSTMPLTSMVIGMMQEEYGRSSCDCSSFLHQLVCRSLQSFMVTCGRSLWNLQSSWGTCSHCWCIVRLFLQNYGDFCHTSWWFLEAMELFQQASTSILLSFRSSV